MIAFHASTVEINEFYIPYGGLHLGGMRSAVICALRKLYNLRDEGSCEEHIYIHRCFLDNLVLYEGTDAGNNLGWQKMFDKALLENPNYNTIKYINEYELDVVPSYSVFKKDNIKIIDRTKMHMDLAEDILRGISVDEYRYDY